MTTLLKPGYLVSLKTSIRGGVSYQRQDLAVEQQEGEGSAARWETTRRIEDLEEYQRAVKARGAAGAKVRGICTHTAFGLLCPEAREGLLNDAIGLAQAIVAAHNESAKTTRIDVFVLRGKIASTDEEATRAIASEVRELLDEMQTGISKVDVAAIRAAASKARQLGAILDSSQAISVNIAVKAAREAATLITKRIATDAPEVIREALLVASGPIESARFTFLELEAGEATAPAPAINVQRMADLAEELH